jgi:hypothetical protein
MILVHGRARFALVSAFVAAVGTACSSGGGSVTTGGTTTGGTTTSDTPCGEAPLITLCVGACVDTNTDGQNCGACGILCQDERICVAGDCANAEIVAHVRCVR